MRVLPSSATEVRIAIFSPAALTTSKPEKAGTLRSLKVRVSVRVAATVESGAGVALTRRAWAAAGPAAKATTAATAMKGAGWK